MTANNELITRLRAAHDDCPVPSEPSLYSAAADALEAAQAADEQLREGLFIVTAERDAAQAELAATKRNHNSIVNDLIAVADQRDAALAERDAALAELVELRAEADVWRHLAAEARSERDAAQAELASVQGQVDALNVVSAKKTVTIRSLRAELEAAQAQLADAQRLADANAHHCNEAGAVAEHWRAERSDRFDAIDTHHKFEQMARAARTQENSAEENR